jgi:hypothetical protein
MTPEEFVACVRQEVMAANMAHYATTLSTDLHESPRS